MVHPSQPSNPVALVGDVNGDGKVDILDAYLVARAIATHASLNPAWDVNRDGVVDQKDVDWIANTSVAHWTGRWEVKRQGFRAATICLRSFAVALILCLVGADRSTIPTQESGSSSSTEEAAVRFASVSVYIDPQAQPLAAWQIEIDAGTPGVKLVGIEGGDASAFHDPPYYDPQALLGGRIVIAAFSLAKDLPTQKNRVARLMVQIPGHARPNYAAKLQVAASPDSRTIPATVSLIEEGAAQ